MYEYAWICTQRMWILYIFGPAAILDITFTWKARNTMELSQKRIQLLRLAYAVIWTIVLPVVYAQSRRKYTCYSTQYESWIGEWCYSPFMVVVVIYLITNAVDLVLFFVPAVSKYIEISNWSICRTISRWTQVQIILFCNSSFLLTCIFILNHSLCCCKIVLWTTNSNYSNTYYNWLFFSNM